MTTMTPEAGVGWNIYEPEKAECINAKIGKVKTQAGNKDVLILELLALNSKRVLIKFFNCIKNRSGHISVNKNSDFAKLYRLGLGENPSSRFSKSQQLVKHFIGVLFECKYEEAESEDHGRYFKVKKISPVVPIITNEWLESGHVRPKPRKTRLGITGSLEKTRKQLGSASEKSWQHLGNKLETTITLEASDSNASSGNSIPLPRKEIQDNKVEPSTSANESVNEENRVSIVRSFWYEKNDGETIEEYHSRAIEDSISLWEWD